jgi:hypothetical protein
MDAEMRIGSDLVIRNGWIKRGHRRALVEDVQILTVDEDAVAATAGDLAHDAELVEMRESCGDGGRAQAEIGGVGGSGSGTNAENGSG